MRYRDGMLAQVIFYALLWLYDDYLGLIISAIFFTIILFLLLFALVVELIEKSKVPRSYFIWMGLSLISSFLGILSFYYSL